MMVKDVAGPAIARAKAADPGNPFVASCERFLANRGHLTVGQLASLAKVTRTRHRRNVGPSLLTDGDARHLYEVQHLEGEVDLGRATEQDLADLHFDYEGGNMQSWDWAGGD